ncbi:MAG: hypothetical protein EOO28_01085 [Comamonadaceae bacterium]|nr:MAG: hypothetical protein EOO28_01085 [Comamonadaceae bacterium]
MKPSRGRGKIPDYMFRLLCCRSTMLRTRPLTPEDVSVMAINALDELVAELVRASGLQMVPAFLDWVADVATPMVDAQVAHAFAQPRFLRSLHVGDPRIALARWVRHWVCPQIVRSFSSLAVFLPEFTVSTGFAVSSCSNISSISPISTGFAESRPMPAVPSGQARHLLASMGTAWATAA